MSCDDAIRQEVEVLAELEEEDMKELFVLAASAITIFEYYFAL